MGVAYFVSTESPIDGAAPEDFDGKALARADEYFEKAVYSQAGVKPLMEFFGDDPRDLLGDEGFEDRRRMSRRGGLLRTRRF
jgi:hypothetical protein